MLRALTTAIGALLLAAAPAAAARSGPCLEDGSGPRCGFRDARVTFVADGDTIRVDVAGDGTRAVKTIRFTGINAMELTRYSADPRRRRGACHGLEATAFVERAIRRSGDRVRLAAQRQTSHAGRRLRRSVWVRSGGRWRDLSRMVLARGLALWLPNPVEWAHNREYALLAQRSAAARLRLYDPAACAAGPAQAAPIEVTVNWDADGDDAGNLGGEWADIRNGGPGELRLGGWVLRDSFIRLGAARAPGYRFPASAAIPPGRTLRLRVGCGADGPLERHWCRSGAVFENVTGGARAMGDGAYLFDPHGDLRAWMIYPCLTACADPLAGRVRLSVRPSGREEIAIENVSGGPVDLGAHTVKLHLRGEPGRFVLGYPFRRGTVVQPGDTMRIRPDGSPSEDTQLVRHLGRGQHLLADGRGAVSLRTMDDVITDCATWGGGRCR